MRRGFLFLLCFSVALSQPAPREPFEIAVQSYYDARASENFDQAAEHREEARGLLAQTPLDSPLFLNRVGQVAQLYQSSGRRAQARAVVEDALSRANSFSESHPTRIQLLSMLAQFWQQDGNLLKALSYLEKAVAALEASPPGASREATLPRPNVVARVVRPGNRIPASSNAHLYQQLADLYRQLGRREAVAEVLARMRERFQSDPAALAAAYEREGNLDEAIALYKKQSDQAAANPQTQVWEVIGPLQTMAMLYQRQQRWQDAAATLEQAVARLEASNRPEAHNQAVLMRLNLANVLQQSGQSQAAEKAYQALLAETDADRNDTQLQILQSYANHLSNTNRADQGEDILKNYLANHLDLKPWQEVGILFSLAQMARKAGRNELADEYQRAAIEKQRAGQPQQVSEGQFIGPDLQKAQAAAAQDNLDEAVNLTLRALASASLARDGQQVAWQAPSIASALARKAPDKGEQIYRELLPLLQAWSVDNVMPLMQALPQYARFLIMQKDRWGEVTAVIDRYRDVLLAAQGAETSGFEQVMQLRIEFARARGTPAEAVAAAEELLALEESLSGTTSLPYMHVVQNVVHVFQFGGNLERALALYRQIISIADLTLPADDAQRSFVRMNAAFALAHARQFDEAERLANEAIAMGERLRSHQTDSFARQLDQIRQMKAAGESGSAPRKGAVNPAGATKWFDVHTFQDPAPGAKPDQMPAKKGGR